MRMSTGKLHFTKPEDNCNAPCREVEWVGNDVWFAHCCMLDDGEMKQFATHGIGIAHCPSSNLRLASGRIQPLDGKAFTVPKREQTSGLIFKPITAQIVRADGWGLRHPLMAGLLCHECELSALQESRRCGSCWIQVSMWALVWTAQHPATVATCCRRSGWLCCCKGQAALHKVHSDPCNLQTCKVCGEDPTINSTLILLLYPLQALMPTVGD